MPKRIIVIAEGKYAWIRIGFLQEGMYWMSTSVEVMEIFGSEELTFSDIAFLFALKYFY